MHWRNPKQVKPENYLSSPSSNPQHTQLFAGGQALATVQLANTQTVSLKGMNNQRSLGWPEQLESKKVGEYHEKRSAEGSPKFSV